MSRIKFSAISLVALAVSLSVTAAYAVPIRLDAPADSLHSSSSALIFAADESTTVPSTSRALLDPATVNVDWAELAKTGIPSQQTSDLAASEPIASGAGLHPMGLMVAMSATAIVPEPSTMVLMGLGAAGLFFMGYRRRRKSA